MSVPDFQSLMLPFLEALQDGQERSVKDLADILAQRFNLSDADRRELLPSGQQTLFSNRIAWTKTHLKNAGLVTNPSRGIVSISDLGKDVLQDHPPKINCRFLKKFPAYLKFIGQLPSEEGEDKDESILDAAKTPRELLDASFDTLQKATAEELLTRLKACSPSFFEQIVVELLRAMGYGGATGEGKVTGQSGDGGIDGIIKEDKLGLDVVCIQAKRWEASVGRPVIQQFVGSMDYHRAKKGVILTTSQFTSDANNYVDRIEGKKVVLIDGITLAGLMIEHDVGVHRIKAYQLKEISNDYFDQDA